MIQISAITYTLHFLAEVPYDERRKLLAYMQKHCDEIGSSNVKMRVIDEQGHTLSVTMEIDNLEKFGGQYRATKFISRAVRKHISSDLHNL
jgi:hypothetical protein